MSAEREPPHRARRPRPVDVRVEAQRGEDRQRQAERQRPTRRARKNEKPGSMIRSRNPGTYGPRLNASVSPPTTINPRTPGDRRQPQPRRQSPKRAALNRRSRASPPARCGRCPRQSAARAVNDRTIRRDERDKMQRRFREPREIFEVATTRRKSCQPKRRPHLRGRQRECPQRRCNPIPKSRRQFVAPAIASATRLTCVMNAS